MCKWNIWIFARFYTACGKCYADIETASLLIELLNFAKRCLFPYNNLTTPPDVKGAPISLSDTHGSDPCFFQKVCQCLKQPFWITDTATLPTTSAMPANLNLNCIPQEILEHVALYTVTTKFLSPPAAIIPLLLTNRRVHSFLSVSSNPHVYARVFAFKYDVAPVIRRLRPERTSATMLSTELQCRCCYLARIHSRTDTKIIRFPAVNPNDTLKSLVMWLFWFLLNPG